MNLPVNATSESADPKKRLIGKDLYHIATISSGRNQVFEVASMHSSSKFILKTFPYIQNEINAYYFNEARFCNLMHPNIVSFKEAIDCAESFDSRKVSYIKIEFIDFKLRDFLKCGGLVDEKLCRTLVHQLVSGVSYLHSRDIAHMDIKIDNILISKDMEAKIIDFDLAYKQSDLILIGTGTQGYRAPELREGRCVDGKAADVYSLAILMFAMLFGRMPYSEEARYKGYDLKNLLWDHKDEFWKIHGHFDGNILNVSQEFKDLFNSMTRFEPSDRITIEDLKKSQWFMKSLYPLKEYKNKMAELLGN
jgi:serine/threonine-protein kinase HSL1, negative regulator of Swe1 kinase